MAESRNYDILQAKLFHSFYTPKKDKTWATHLKQQFMTAKQ